MFSWMKDKSPNTGYSDKSKYLKYILVFGIVFTALQISDLTLTQYALKNPEIREVNPLYSLDWFIPVKLAMVFLVMNTMYRQPVQNQRLAKNAMLGIIVMYVFISLNNLYFILLI